MSRVANLQRQIDQYEDTSIRLDYERRAKEELPRLKSELKAEQEKQKAKVWIEANRSEMDRLAESVKQQAEQVNQVSQLRSWLVSLKSIIDSERNTRNELIRLARLHAKNQMTLAGDWKRGTVGEEMETAEKYRSAHVTLLRELYELETELIITILGDDQFSQLLREICTVLDIRVSDGKPRFGLPEPVTPNGHR